MRSTCDRLEEATKGRCRQTERQTETPYVRAGKSPCEAQTHWMTTSGRLPVGSESSPSPVFSSPGWMIRVSNRISGKYAPILEKPLGLF